MREVNNEDKIDPVEIERKNALLREAKIDPDFNRNSGETKSIWGKWLQSKLAGKKYDEITERMKVFANKMPQPDEMITNLFDNSIPFRELEYNNDNWEKEFPNNRIKTILGEFRFGDGFKKKLEKGRKYLFGLIKPTLLEPEYILIGPEYETAFYKAFKGKTQKIILSILKYKEKEEIIISIHPRKEKDIIKKVKESKLLVYERRAGAHREDKQFTAAGRLNFNDNIQNKTVESNETWAYFKSAGKIDIIEIIYIVEVFKYCING